MKLKLTYFLLLFTCYTYAQNAWQSRSYQAGPRYRGASFTIGNNIYFTCGYDADEDERRDVWEYNTITNTWRERAFLPAAARSGPTAFSINGKGYICGGRGSSNVLKDLWEYDTTSNTWTQKANIPASVGLGGLFSFVINGQAYVGGGYSNHVGATCNYSFWRYNPTLNTWTTMASIPSSAYPAYSAAFAIGDNGYIVGGTCSNYSDYLWQYNSVSNTWSQKASLPDSKSRSDMVAFSIGNKGYAGTGYAYFHYNEFFEYNPDSNKWFTLTPLPGLRRGAFSGVVGERAFVGGGRDIPVGGSGPYFQQNMYELSKFFTQTNWGSSNSITLCTGTIDSMPIRVYNGYPVDTDNVYTVQLSNRNGQFDSISYQTTFKGNIVDYKTIYLKPPAGVLWGYNYRLRVISSKPYRTSLSQATYVSNQSYSMSVSPSLTVCQGQKITLSVNSTANYFQWYKNGVALSAGTTSSIDVSTAGKYKCRMDVIEYCTMMSHDTEVFVNPSPVLPVITRQSDTLFTNAVATSYQWYRNDTAISGANTNTILATKKGMYKVEVANQFDCKSISAGFNFAVFTGIHTTQPQHQGSGVFVYPTLLQPGDDIHINYAEPFQSVKISTIDGKLVYEAKQPTTIRTYLPKGIYLVTLTSISGQNFHQRICIQ